MRLEVLVICLPYLEDILFSKSFHSVQMNNCYKYRQNILVRDKPCSGIFETKYSRMNQVKFAEESL